jgi:hypothetical protein
MRVVREREDERAASLRAIREREDDLHCLLGLVTVFYT